MEDSKEGKDSMIIYTRVMSIQDLRNEESSREVKCNTSVSDCSRGCPTSGTHQIWNPRIVR